MKPRFQFNLFGGRINKDRVVFKWRHRKVKQIMWQWALKGCLKICVTSFKNSFWSKQQDLHVDSTLNGLILGESLLNDAVALVLCSSIEEYSKLSLLYHSQFGTHSILVIVIFIVFSLSSNKQVFNNHDGSLKMWSLFASGGSSRCIRFEWISTAVKFCEICLM